MSEEIMNVEPIVLRKITAVIAYDMCIEQLDAELSEYREEATRHPDKPVRDIARYRMNKCQKTLDMISSLRSDVYRELKPTKIGVHVFNGAVNHYSDLLFDIVNLEIKNQDRVKGLIKKLKKL